MSGNILFYLFITILVVVIYKYYDGLFFYIKPYFDKSREENMAKIKSKPRPREEMSNNKNNIITLTRFYNVILSQVYHNDLA